MSKTPRLSKSGIEYLDYSWGVFSGCHNLQDGLCPINACWARGIALHYPELYPSGFEPHYYNEAINSPKHLKKPSRIGVSWVGDIIGYGLAFREQIFETIRQCPQHIFLFLTKNPDQLTNWGNFPDNCWVGVSATDYWKYVDACNYLAQIDAKVKYISFEPLLSWDKKASYFFNSGGISWVIIGSQTKPYRPPTIEAVQDIAKACDKAGVKVFLKDNLRSLLQKNNHNVYSFPEWAGKQFAVTGNHSLAPCDPHPNEPMRQLRQDMPR